MTSESLPVEKTITIVAIRFAEYKNHVMAIRNGNAMNITIGENIRRITKDELTRLQGN